MINDETIELVVENTISTGISDYTRLKHKPTLNGVTIEGEKTSADYNLALPSDAFPQNLNTEAAPGSSEYFSRADHIHPFPSAIDVGAVASNQGNNNAWKFMIVNNDGTVTPAMIQIN